MWRGIQICLLKEKKRDSDLFVEGEEEDLDLFVEGDRSWMVMQ